MVDIQERGLCGVIFAVGELKMVVQLLSTQMAFQAWSNHFLKVFERNGKLDTGR